MTAADFESQNWKKYTAKLSSSLENHFKKHDDITFKQLAPKTSSRLVDPSLLRARVCVCVCLCVCGFVGGGIGK